MGRLTFWKDGIAYIEKGIDSVGTAMNEYEAVKKLAKYEDMEETGDLVSFKIGDPAWEICPKDGSIKGHTITEINIREDKITYLTKVKVGNEYVVSCFTGDLINDIFFKSLEEARKALKEIGY